MSTHLVILAPVVAVTMKHNFTVCPALVVPGTHVTVRRACEQLAPVDEGGVGEGVVTEGRHCSDDTTAPEGRGNACGTACVN